MVLLYGFGRAEVYADCPKRRSAGLLRCAIEDISTPRDFEVYKACRFHTGLKLCFQQSASDSTSP